MAKEVIAVDIDEVLFPFLPEFLRDYNSIYSTKHEVGHFDTYEFEHVLGLDFEETVGRVYQFNAKDSLHVEPLEGSKGALKDLSSKYDLAIITARHPKHAGVTHSWINEYFPDVFERIIPIGHPRVMEQTPTKAEVCSELGAIALVDDSVQHVEVCAQTGVQGILFGNYPWNKTNGNLPDNVIRCQNWQAVKEHFIA